jgi:hypothetical protein
VNISVHDDLIESLAELCRVLPSMRLGQLIANMATVARGAVPGAIWDAEDDELLGAIRWQLQELASRTAAEDAEGREKVGAAKGGVQGVEVPTCSAGKKR